MILLVTAFAAGQKCATGLEEATGLAVHWAENLQLAAARLRSGSYQAVVLDQFLTETEPVQVATLLKHAGTAVVLQLSFGISGMNRIVREVQSALERRLREEGAVRRAVQSQMRSEFGEALTGVLLSCQSALAAPGLPETAIDKFRLIDGLARDMCGRLGAQG